MTTSQKRAELLNDMCDLGKMCLKDGDIEQALYWLNLAASHGNDRANFALDDVYYYDFDPRRYTPEDTEYLSRSRDADEKSLMRKLVYISLYRSGVKKDVESPVEVQEESDGERAVRYFTELAADDTNDWARFALGCMYLYGCGVDKDVFKAGCCFAAMNEPYRFGMNAIFDLAEKYRTGDGVERDIDIAIAWYKDIIEYDDLHTEALFALAEIYFRGDGVERDLEAAQYYLDKVDTGLRNKI